MISLAAACPAGQFIGVRRVNFRIPSAEVGGDQNQAGGEHENEIELDEHAIREEGGQPQAKKMRTSGRAEVILLSDDSNFR